MLYDNITTKKEDVMIAEIPLCGGISHFKIVLIAGLVH